MKPHIYTLCMAQAHIHNVNSIQFIRCLRFLFPSVASTLSRKVHDGF